MEQSGETHEEAWNLHQDPTDPGRELNPPQLVDQRNRTGRELSIRSREEITLHKDNNKIDVGTKQ